jgi:hypothetical protein
MVKISKETHVKAKKGQILILVLILMAVGLIVMSPLLHYLDSSYNLYLSKLNDTTAYYTVDAMMGQIFSDMYAGQDIYILNTSNSSRYNPAGEWLNGCKISTSINNSIAVPPPSSEEADWIYMDPGCAFGLNTLAYNASHSFNVSLIEGTTVTANWYFKDTKAGSCNYYCIGKMWITYLNNSTVRYGNSSEVSIGPLSNGVSTAFQKQLSWTVPQGGSGNYYIKFQNLAVRGSGGGCGNVTRSMSDMIVKPTFSGIGDPLYTWVRMGNSSGGQVHQYQDYTIKTTARMGNTDIASVTACVRQTPGPLMWWEHQSLAVVSWAVTYY